MNSPSPAVSIKVVTLGGARNTLASIASVLLLAPAAFGSPLNPIQWTLSTDGAAVAPGKTVLLRLHAEVEPGFHVYSLTTPEGGPIPTTIQLAPSPMVRKSVVYQPKPERRNDPTFNVPIELFSGSTDFLIAATLQDAIAEGTQTITAKARYQACSDQICLPPAERSAETGIAVRAGAPVPLPEIPTGYQLASGPSPAAAPEPSAGKPSLDPHFLLLAFGFGLAGIFTPCVFPMVPLTVSYFLGRNPASRRAVLAQALPFCTGIVVLFSVMGFVVTLISRPFGLVQLSSSPWVNGLIAAVFFGLGLSLLGAFEIGSPVGIAD
jgi:thiol:disulfide interchange protein